jgi:serine/threonine-protein kinase
MVQFFGRRGEQWYYVEAYVPLAEAEKASLCPPAPAPTSTLTPVPTPTDNPKTPEAGAARMREADGMVMLYVPAGGFHMGSPPGEPWDQGESPLHTVYLDAFWVYQTEVTNAQYERCVQAGVCQVMPEMSSYDPQAKPDYPVEVTWSDAQAYCQWAGSRLPTEAEWEKAARGTDGRRWPWGNARPDCSLSNSFGKDGSCVGAPTSVGSCPAGASPYGALDMAGNVDEWVSDWYGYEYYSVSPGRNPQGPAAGEMHVVRGGNWDSIPDWVRCAWRGAESEGGFRGFRCAASAAGTP